MNLEDVVKKLLEIGKDRVIFILLFGSMARGDVRRDSDIDLAVYYEGDPQERFEFRINATGALPNNVDLHTFQDLPLYVLHQAIKEGKLIYVKDKEKAMEVLLHASREAEDFMRRMKVVTGAT